MSQRFSRAIAATVVFLTLDAAGDSALAGPDGLSEAGVYALDSSGLIAPVSPYPGNATSTYSVGAYPLAPTPLVRGSGQELVESYCSICHSVTLIGAQPRLPPEIWKKEVDKMIHLGAPIPTEMVGQIVDYLQKHYGSPQEGNSPSVPAPKPNP
ncbi:MAG: cytochrome C [Methylacidiphilaceae bacterium]|nr:cytochrome C [Candidatus Methylacidiphilaceae bacterium]